MQLKEHRNEQEEIREENNGDRDENKGASIFTFDLGDWCDDTRKEEEIDDAYPKDTIGEGSSCKQFLFLFHIRTSLRALL